MSTAAQRGLPRVCIVTGEAVGLASGGIGTAMTGLAEALAEGGHHVTLLYTKGYLLTKSERRAATRRFAANGVTFEAIDAADLRQVYGPFACLDYPIPAAVYGWLRRREVEGCSFDILHGNDTDADCALVIAAKQAGIAFRDTTLCTAVHSPRAWVQELNEQTILMPVSVAMEEAERAVIRDADLVWAPSRYMLDWVEAKGFPEPKRKTVQPYVLPRGSLPVRADLANNARVERLVFFGRLERRKGLLTVLEALKHLAPRLVADRIAVTFLGSSTRIDGRPAEAVIDEALSDTGLSHEILGNLDQPQALSYLAVPGRLALIASPADNSPCTVYEVLEAGIPFLAARGGGIPELIDRSSDDPTFDPTVDGLIDKLTRRLDSPGPLPRPKNDQQAIAKAWRAHHSREGWAPLAASAEHATEHPADRPLAIVGGQAAIAEALGAVAVPPTEAWPESHDLLLVHPDWRPLPEAVSRLRVRLAGQIGAWQPSALCKGRTHHATGGVLASLLRGLLPTGALYLPAAATASIRCQADVERALYSGVLVLRSYPEAIGYLSRPVDVVPPRPDQIARFADHAAPYLHETSAILAASGAMRPQRFSGRHLMLRLARSPLGGALPTLVKMVRRLT